jgi:hypothetical protein
LQNLIFAFWIDILEQPTDRVDREINTAKNTIRKYHFEGKWNEVFDIMVIILETAPPSANPTSLSLPEILNNVLIRESVGYRIINSKLVEITAEEEIAAIEEALKVPQHPVRAHLNRALELFADRQKPDYRNSIKESISAVEAFVKIKTGSDKGTLGQLLKSVQLHSALQAAFSSLYGYTSDKDGIRHALMGEENLTTADAKFFLVSCSAFINYLQEKLSS